VFENIIRKSYGPGDFEESGIAQLFPCKHDDPAGFLYGRMTSRALQCVQNKSTTCDCTKFNEFQLLSLLARSYFVDKLKGCKGNMAFR